MQAIVKRDAEIQQQVMQELRWDTRIEATDVGVEVREGVVTLSGTVSTYAQKVAAQEAAHRVAGVFDVANDLHVHIPGVLGQSDADIAQAVRHALEWNVLVSAENVRTTVSDGWVTLEGADNACDISCWPGRFSARRESIALRGSFRKGA